MLLPQPTRTDWVLAGALVLLGQLTTWLRLGDPGDFSGSRLANAAMAVAVVVPLLWVRTRPAGAAVVCAGMLAASHPLADLDVTVLATFVPLVVTTAACGYHGSQRQAVIGAAAAVAGLLVVSFATLPELRTPVAVPFNLSVLLGPWAAARGLRHREDRARRLGAELVRERHAMEDRVAAAVQRERARIARELHDIVAHGVSVMVVQIGGARLQAADREAANLSLLQAEEAGRQALADLRCMLGLLRTELNDAPNGQPRPGLAQLPALVERAMTSGVELDLRTDVAAGELPAAADVSAYRIVQEAITNVLRHSHAKQATVSVETNSVHLTIDVHDRGPARSSSVAPGYGLVGIRERAMFLGGHASAGPAPEGGWRVSAEIPLVKTARVGMSR